MAGDLDLTVARLRLILSTVNLALLDIVTALAVLDAGEKRIAEEIDNIDKATKEIGPLIDQLK